jgi:nitroreductase
MDHSSVLQAIRNRRSVFPAQYTGEPIEREIIEQLLELANWAPTHKKTQPWRFKVIYGEGLKRLSAYMVDYYDENTPSEEVSEIKRNKMRKNPLKAGAIIAIILSRDEAQRVPEWEELAAVSCAVENMWIAASAMGLGSFWSTPPAALHAKAFLNLESNERSLGFFYLGKIAQEVSDSDRDPVSDKTEWIEA